MKLRIIMAFVLCLLLAAQCFGCASTYGESNDAAIETKHTHVYSEANCTTPKTCDCGATDGVALGHEFKNATCISPAACSRCGTTDGDALGHLFIDATCIEPRICNRCGYENGRPLGHKFSEATYDAPKTCQNCGKTTGTKLELSGSCDVILASGRENNGDFYELVAKQTEDYNGATVEIGIIKNNEWLLKPTSNMPFVDADGTPYGTNIKSIYLLDDAKIIYIGNGCFLFEAGRENMIYNAESKQSYEKYLGYDQHICLSYDCLRSYFSSKKHEFSDIHLLSSKDSLLIIDYCYGSLDTKDCVELLDTNTMDVFSLEVKNYMSEHVYPISEGVFAVANFHNRINFFGIEGFLLFESDFTIRDYNQRIWFNNGICCFEILNDAGTPYRITIDMDGNVLESEKIK